VWRYFSIHDDKRTIEFFFVVKKIIMNRYKPYNSIKSQQSTVSLPKEEVNVVLLGKQNVGKSALIVKYLTKRFICEYDPFLGWYSFRVE
jgi:GTP-binding protein EngB required for normal cell division